MTQEATKQAVLTALATHSTSVIALSGDWGTGKTHLLRELSNELEVNKNYKILSLSTLAFKSVDDLKTGLTTHLFSMYAGVIANDIADIVALDTLNGLVGGGVKKIVGVGADLGKHFLPAGLQMRISDAYVFLPKLRGKLPTNFLISIDDIERTEKLDISELLGFVNFLIEELKVQLLLVLNSEQLKDKRLEHWQQMREKVVNRSISLTIDAEEAAEIALKGMPKDEADSLTRYLVKLGVKNIRIAQHVRRNWETIRGNRTFSQEVVEGLTKSIALLTAVYLKANAMADWPNMEFILNSHLDVRDDDESSERGMWKKKLREYDFGYADEFEKKVLLPFLETGHLDEDALNVYLKDVDVRLEREEIGRQTEKLIFAHFWDVQATKQTLLQMVDRLMDNVKAMTAAQATRIALIAKEYDLAKSTELIDLWIGEHRPEIMASQVGEHNFDGLSNLDPKIAAIYQLRKNQLYPPHGSD